MDETSEGCRVVVSTSLPDEQTLNQDMGIGSLGNMTPEFHTQSQTLRDDLPSPRLQHSG